MYVPCLSPCLFTHTIRRKRYFTVPVLHTWLISLLYYQEKKHWNILLCLLNKCTYLVHLHVYSPVLSGEKGTKLVYYACLTSVRTLFISVSIDLYYQEKKSLKLLCLFASVHTLFISLYYQDRNDIMYKCVLLQSTHSITLITSCTALSFKKMKTVMWSVNKIHTLYAQEVRTHMLTNAVLIWNKAKN